jgi:hypothetical protein
MGTATIAQTSPRVARHGASRYDPGMLLPLLWTVFVVLAVISFGMIAAYWLDVQDRPDLSYWRRVGYSVAAIVFPITLPLYALGEGAGWPRVLRIGAFVPVVALALFFAFLFGLIH